MQKLDYKNYTIEFEHYSTYKVKVTTFIMNDGTIKVNREQINYTRKELIKSIESLEKQSKDWAMGYKRLKDKVKELEEEDIYVSIYLDTIPISFYNAVKEGMKIVNDMNEGKKHFEDMQDLDMLGGPNG